MAETSQIARMAVKISEEIFEEFLWQKLGPEDQNWPCEKQSIHGVITHPTDVVFYYEDPYSDLIVYVQCDLKSYAAGSIGRSQVEIAIVSLSRQVACAEISGTWQERYTHQSGSFAVAGLLFIYNHDGGYDRCFSDILAKLKLVDLDQQPENDLWVLGPVEIHWLHNVVLDIQRARGKQGSDRLPDRDRCSFFYPQQTNRAKLRVDRKCPASLEMLTRAEADLSESGFPS